MDIGDQYIFFCAIRDDNIDKINKLISEGINVHKRMNDDETINFYPRVAMMTESIIDKIKNNSASLMDFDMYNKIMKGFRPTPLEFAIEYRKRDIISILMNNYEIIEPTELHYGLMFCDDIIELLLQNMNKNIIIPFHILEYAVNFSQQSIPIMMRYDINFFLVDDDNVNLLGYAKDTDTCNMLLEYGIILTMNEIIKQIKDAPSHVPQCIGLYYKRIVVILDYYFDDEQNTREESILDLYDIKNGRFIIKKSIIDPLNQVCDGLEKPVHVAGYSLLIECIIELLDNIVYYVIPSLYLMCKDVQNNQ